MERVSKDCIMLMCHLPKSTRRNTKMIDVTTIENLDTIRNIVQNGKHGSKNKRVSLVLLYVSNQIWQKFLITLGGLTPVVQLMFSIQCKDSL